MIEVNDVIQINERIPEWTGCLMIVDEVTDLGILAGMKIPMNGTAYLRVRHNEYELIGKLVDIAHYTKVISI